MSAAWACWVSTSVSASSCCILELSEVSGWFSGWFDWFPLIPHFQVFFSVPNYLLFFFFCFANFCCGFFFVSILLFTTITLWYNWYWACFASFPLFLANPSCKAWDGWRNPQRCNYIDSESRQMTQLKHSAGVRSTITMTSISFFDFR